MNQIINEDIYRKIDEERIKQALEDGNRNDASVLFKYSVLTKEEFNQLQQQHTYYGLFDKQMKSYFKQKEKEIGKEKEIAKIEKAFRNHDDQIADVLFKYSSYLTEDEFREIKRKWRVPKED